MNTIGDHIRKVRLDRGLRQRDVADIVGVDHFTVLNWETEATKPKFLYMPAIIRFLGYDPYSVDAGQALHVRLKAHRTRLGLSQKELAGLLKVNECTVSKWEAGKSKKPFRETLEKVGRFLALF